MEHVRQLQANVQVDALNIPEVRNETRKNRITTFVRKWQPRDFALSIQKSLGDQSPEFLIDRGVVHTNWSNQRMWLEKTSRDFEFRNLVLVGGQSSTIRYPGPGVEEAAIHIQNEKTLNLFLGAVTIPAREEESHRLLRKTESGIEFFISQVIFESDLTQRLLRDYHTVAKNAGVGLKPLFLSFAPVSSKLDIEFLRWWDVVIPKETERYILSKPSGILERSITTSLEIFDEIASFVHKMKFRAPLAINVEHVSIHNLEASVELASAFSREIDRLRTK
ncbi:hypothetical protein HY229_07890 [Candidatus Acetothermia bacterium]|nr:hypothetical protein [Candidatus Acetothermia bacterium]MBI3644000.1 hypothetical protein [Candidatus Acetothermia bacterium]